MSAELLTMGLALHSPSCGSQTLARYPSHLEDFPTHRLPASQPPSGLAGLGWDQDCEVLTKVQVTLKLLMAGVRHTLRSTVTEAS